MYIHIYNIIIYTIYIGTCLRSAVFVLVGGSREFLNSVRVLYYWSIKNDNIIFYKNA